MFYEPRWLGYVSKKCQRLDSEMFYVPANFRKTN